MEKGGYNQEPNKRFLSIMLGADRGDRATVRQAGSPVARTRQQSGRQTDGRDRATASQAGRQADRQGRRLSGRQTAGTGDSQARLQGPDDSQRCLGIDRQTGGPNNRRKTWDESGGQAG